MLSFHFDPLCWPHSLLYMQGPFFDAQNQTRHKDTRCLLSQSLCSQPLAIPLIQLLHTNCDLLLHRYDLNLEEMRALTFERVKFTMGLPLLRRAIQEQVSAIVLLLCVLGNWLCCLYGMCLHPLSCPALSCPWLLRLSQAHRQRNKGISRNNEIFVYKTNIILGIKFKYLSNVNNWF